VTIVAILTWRVGQDTLIRLVLSHSILKQFFGQWRRCTGGCSSPTINFGFVGESSRRGNLRPKMPNLRLKTPDFGETLGASQFFEHS